MRSRGEDLHDGGSVSGEDTEQRKSQSATLLPTSPELRSLDQQEDNQDSSRKSTTPNYTKVSNMEVKPPRTRAPRTWNKSGALEQTSCRGAEADFLYRSRGSHKQTHVHPQREGTEAALLPLRSSSHQKRPHQRRPEVWVLA
jgi:hypothetical protein